MKRTVLVLVVIFVVAIMLATEDLRELRVGQGSAGLDLLFRASVVRTVREVAPAEEISIHPSVADLEEIKVSFLGLPVTCMVSRGVQQEDPCKIYRSGYNHVWESIPVNPRWEFKSGWHEIQ